MDEQEKNEYEKMKEEIDGIRLEYANAKKVLRDIVALNNTLQSSSLIFDNWKKESQISYDFIKKHKEEIDGLVTSSKNHVDEVMANLQKVKADIDSMRAAYSEFSEIKGKVSGVGSEIETLLATSRSLYNDISLSKEDAQKMLLDIKTTYQSVVENIQSMQTAYQDFLLISSKLNDKETGLQAIFDVVQNINKQSSGLLLEIKTFRDNSKALLSEIEKNKERTDKLKDDIDSNFKYTETKKLQIEAATGLIIDTSFAETFKARQRQIEDGLYSWRSWKSIFLGSIVALVLIVIFKDFGKMPWYELFFTRIFYTSPLLFLIAYSAIQYSKERDLAEKYAFKAASSAAIRSHVDYLIEKFKDDPDSLVLNFAKDTFSTIYKEPYATHDNLEERMTQLEKRFNDSDNRSYSNMSEMVKDIKELKELIPEPSVFEQVMGIFSSVFNKK